jgi:hypothetical protein
MLLLTIRDVMGGEETQSETSHHDSRELGRSEKFGLRSGQMKSEEEHISLVFCLATKGYWLFRCVRRGSAYEKGLNISECVNMFVVCSDV